MAKQDIAKMSVEALIKLRNDIGRALSRKAEALKHELEAIGADHAGIDLITPRRRTSIAGRKIPAKYRGPKGELWAGRGAQPVWMTEAVKKGAKREDFLIDKSVKAVTKKTAK